MRTQLTPKLLDSLRPATAKRYEVRDTLLVGLLMLVISYFVAVFPVAFIETASSAAKGKVHLPNLSLRVAGSISPR
jgi:hypothetical protein